VVAIPALRRSSGGGVGRPEVFRRAHQHLIDTPPGLSTTDLGFWLRYEIRREFAPYVGVSWNRKCGETADFAEAVGEDTGGARFVTGLRLWF
jgi:uncharacterized protein involved in copper resistance